MSNSLLTNVKVASPCQAEWKWMYGNARVRFCPQCNLNVYNLSSMSKEEAELLILQTEGQLCVRFYRRKDGTILTSNCPVGLRAFRDKFTSVKARIATALLSLMVYTWVMVGMYPSRPGLRVLSVIGERLGRPPVQVQIMGAIAGPREPSVSMSEKLMRERAIQKLIPMSHQTGQSSVHGIAVVDIVVSESGRVDDATFKSGPEEVAQLCEEAAQGWTFQPTKIAGRSVRVRTTLTFNFK
jgi:hypothetical protein